MIFAPATIRSMGRILEKAKTPVRIAVITKKSEQKRRL